MSTSPRGYRLKLVFFKCFFSSVFKCVRTAAFWYLLKDTYTTSSLKNVYSTQFSSAL